MCPVMQDPGTNEKFDTFMVCDGEFPDTAKLDSYDVRHSLTALSAS